MRRGRAKDEDRETAAALQQLRELNSAGYRFAEAPRSGEPPGDFNIANFTGGSGRLNGRFATATWGPTTLLLFEWEVAFEQEFADGTAHGDYWDNPVPLKQMWTGTARFYMTTELPGAAYAAAGWTTWAAANYGLYHASDVNGDPAAATFTGYNRGDVGNHPIFTGSCYVSRYNLNAPRSGMVVQEAQLRGIGAPSVGPAP